MSENSFFKGLHKGATSLALLLCIAYAFSFGASTFWFSDILRHFIFQYCIGATILGGFFICIRKRYAALIMLVILLCTAYEIYSVTPKSPPPPASDETIKVALYNKLYFAQNQKHLMNWITEENPDIVIIQEADPDALNTLKQNADYPYILERILPNPFGFILLSKYPISNPTIGETERHVINNIYGHAHIAINEKTVTSVYAVHPVPPVSYEHTTQRNRDLDIISELIQNDPNKNIIVAGDFNITPYSPQFKKLLKKTNLLNQYTSMLPVPSWPSPFFDYIFQIPIDHILHKGDLHLIEKRRGPSMGSDHYPLIATFAIQ